MQNVDTKKQQVQPKKDKNVKSVLPRIMFYDSMAD